MAGGEETDGSIINKYISETKNKKIKPRQIHLLLVINRSSELLQLKLIQKPTPLHPV